MGYRIGVDVGGSFTDFAVLDENGGQIRTLKVLSRPDAPGTEIVDGLRQLEERYGIQPSDVTYFTHGTTVGINTVIQRNGASLALFTTAGFEDVLEMARLKIPQIHNLFSRRPAPLISRNRVFGIVERLDAQGAVVAPVDRASVVAGHRAAKAAGAQGIVIAFLHSYRDPSHEHAVRAMLAAIDPELPVLCSSDVWPIIREYERTLTAVISGYVQPKVAHYLASFERTLIERGVRAAPHITKSNGGIMSAARARDDCASMILSGTASGVIGAHFIAAACGLPRLLSLDIGGTSADVAVIADGRVEYGVGETVGDFSIHVPSVSVTSIGQGGGSIATVDDFGVLKVGPHSAGSLPGPACFGRGGTRPTLTDAVAACGLIGQARLGYSAITVDRAKAAAAIAPLAAQIGMGVDEAAAAIIAVAVSGMYADTSALMSRFGIDPRSYAVLAFGGAGPMLACFLARELNIPRVVVPLTPGVLSALGGLVADLKTDVLRTLYADLVPGLEGPLRKTLAAMRGEAEDWLRGEQGFTGEARLQVSGDMRYVGQSYEIETVLDPAAIETGDLSAIAAAFHAQHATVYGHADPDAPVQLIALRLVIAGDVPKPQLPRIPEATEALSPAATVSAYVDGARRNLPLYRRETLRAGHRFEGPAIVVQDDCTTCVPTGFGGAVDPFGNLILTLHAAEIAP